MHRVARELILHLIRRDKAVSRATLMNRRYSTSTGQQFVSSLLQLDLSCRWCLKYIYEFTQTHLSWTVCEPTNQKHSVGYKWITSKCSWQTSDKAGDSIISVCKTSQIFITFWPVILILFTFKTRLFASLYADILLLLFFFFFCFDSRCTYILTGNGEGPLYFANYVGLGIQHNYTLWQKRWDRCIRAKGEYFKGDGGI
jgi:hypothetical protein